MDSDDLAFFRWACKRNTWLWRAGFGPRRWKSKTAAKIAQRAAIMSMQFDRLRWTLGLVDRTAIEASDRGMR